MKTKHLFLTGEKQVGKTTVIRTFLSRSGLSADGFITFWETSADTGGKLYIAPFDTGSISEEKYLIVNRDERQRALPEKIVQVFDVHGCDILGRSGKRDIIVMDELGFFESKAIAFQKSIMRHISGDVPVLGVIRPMQTEFLDEIRSHPAVRVLEITEENRNAIPEWMLEHGLVYNSSDNK